VEGLGVHDVLETVAPERAQGHSIGQRVLYERARCIRQHYLPPVSGRGDARCPVHVHADVVVTADDGLSGVHADPHAYVVPGGPRVGEEAALHSDGGPKRAGGARKAREERVAGRAHLDASALCDRSAQDRPMSIEHRQGAVAELVQERGGPLDVGEHERDGPRGQLGHARLAI
jgi:hypothetical protein